MQDLYQILGVARNAETDDIQKAYRKRSLQTHSDHGGDAEQHLAVQKARHTLADPNLRREYDISIGQRPQAFGVQQLVDDGSTYGSILKLLERVQPLRTFDLQIPTIVVIGDESHGKSSLMERLTMREYFATGRSFCTKVAVRMRLRKVAADHPFIGHVRVCRITFNQAGGRVDGAFRDFTPENLAGAPERIFVHIQRVYKDEGLDGEADRVLAQEEVEIKVWAADVPNLDLVDLPGIVQRAPLNAATLAITQRYLREPHALAVCVVDGQGDSAASNSAALRECAELADRTVIVVTKLDRLSYTDMRDRFREICKGMRHHDQSRIIPVINRDSSPKPTLHAAIQEEQKNILFERWREEDTDQAVGITAVLRALDGMLQRYVRTVWVETELKRIDTELTRIDAELVPLGVPPSQCASDEVLAALRGALRATLNSDIFEQSTATTWEWAREAFAPKLEVASSSRFELSSLGIDLEVRWEAACRLLLSQADNLIAALISDAFNAANDLPMRLQRFHRFHSDVLQEATARFGRAYIHSDPGGLFKHMLERGQFVLHSKLRQIRRKQARGSISEPDLFDAAVNELVSELIDIVFDKVLVHVTRHDFVITTGELEEDEETTRTRERLGRQRDDVLAAKQGVEQLLDTVAPYAAPNGEASGGCGVDGGGSVSGGGGDGGPPAVGGEVRWGTSGGFHSGAPPKTPEACPVCGDPGRMSPGCPGCRHPGGGRSAGGFTFGGGRGKGSPPAGGKGGKGGFGGFGKGGTGRPFGPAAAASAQANPFAGFL